MIIKVVFLPKLSAPKNLQLQVYYIETDNFNIAEENSRIELVKHADILSEQFKIDKKDCLNYFDKILMTEIKVIKPGG